MFRTHLAWPPPQWDGLPQTLYSSTLLWLHFHHQPFVRRAYPTLSPHGWPPLYFAITFSWWFTSNGLPGSHLFQPGHHLQAVPQRSYAAVATACFMHLLLFKFSLLWLNPLSVGEINFPKPHLARVAPLLRIKRWSQLPLRNKMHMCAHTILVVITKATPAWCAEIAKYRKANEK